MKSNLDPKGELQMQLINHCETCKKTFMGYSVYLPKKKLHFCNWECYKVYEDKYKLTLN